MRVHENNGNRIHGNRVHENRVYGKRVHKNINDMSDRELRSYRRVLRLRRERRRKCMTLGLTLIAVFCMVMICTVSYGSIKSQANSGFKYYTGVTVESGETLWSLADKYIDYDYYKDMNSYIAEVQSINHLDDDEAIQAGQMLVVPYYSAEYVY